MSLLPDDSLRAQLLALLGLAPDARVRPFSVALSLSPETLRDRLADLTAATDRPPFQVVGEAALTEHLRNFSPSPMEADGTVRPGVSISSSVRLTADGGLEAKAEGWVPLDLDGAP